jgi:hypothetical protein
MAEFRRLFSRKILQAVRRHASLPLTRAERCCTNEHNAYQSMRATA